MDNLTPAIFFNDAAFAEEFLYILDKRKQKVKLRFKPLQLDLLSKLTGRDLVLKARQVGISTCIQARLYRLAATSAVATATLSHEDKSTQKFRRMTDRFWRNMPESFRPARKYANSALTTYPDFDSEAEIYTAGNTATGRSGTYTHVHGSEVAFWPDAEALVAGLMQGGNPQIVLESTPNGAQGYFYNLCMEALDGSDWTLHFYPWWWEPEYALPLPDGEVLSYRDDELELIRRHALTAEQILWRRSKQRELKHLFAQEYPEDPRSCFLLSGAGYFGDLSGVFAAPMDATYESDHVYYAGLDFGQTTDYTACSVMDKTANAQVALLRINRLSWREMRRQVRELCKAWHVRALHAEKNSMGKTNIEEMWREFAEDGVPTPVMVFETTNASKAAIMSSLHEALHHGGLKLLPDAAQKREMLAFTSRQTATGLWQLGAPDGEHDDIVIANALANYGMTQPVPSSFVDYIEIE